MLPPSGLNERPQRLVVGLEHDPLRTALDRLLDIDDSRRTLIYFHCESEVTTRALQARIAVIRDEPQRVDAPTRLASLATLSPPGRRKGNAMTLP